MKKGLLFFIACLLTTNLFAQEWTPIGSPNPTAPNVKLLSCSEQKTTVEFRLEGFYQETVGTPQGPQQVINAPKMASILEEGAPDLPLFAIPLTIGDMAEMKVEVEDLKYQEFENIEIAPSKGNLSREIDPASVPYRYGEMYSKNAFYPDFQAKLSEPYILRDFRGQNIIV